MARSARTRVATGPRCSWKPAPPPPPARLFRAWGVRLGWDLSEAEQKTFPLPASGSLLSWRRRRRLSCACLSSAPRAAPVASEGRGAQARCAPWGRPAAPRPAAGTGGGVLPAPRPPPPRGSGVAGRPPPRLTHPPAVAAPRPLPEPRRDGEGDRGCSRLPSFPLTPPGLPPPSLVSGGTRRPNSSWSESPEGRLDLEGPALRTGEGEGTRAAEVQMWVGSRCN